MCDQHENVQIKQFILKPYLGRNLVAFDVFYYYARVLYVITYIDK